MGREMTNDDREIPWIMIANSGKDRRRNDEDDNDDGEGGREVRTRDVCLASEAENGRVFFFCSLVFRRRDFHVKLGLTQHP